MLDIVKTEKGEPATIAEMAVLNFSELADLKGKTDQELAEVCRRQADFLYNVSYIALAQFRTGKDELVSAIRKDPKSEAWFGFVKMLSDGQDTARTLLQFLTSAECRLMCALATVAEEEGVNDDPDGGEEIPVQHAVA